MTVVETRPETGPGLGSATEPETGPETGAGPDFAVHLDVFDGPFDTLLGLIAAHRLDITEVALATVTDEFIAYVSALGPDLERSTQFLVVAATLLDLKTARLLPQADGDDEEDLALLEARDLLFARLLQYRAFGAVAAALGSLLATESRRYPRAVRLEQRYARLLPEVVLDGGSDGLAAAAARALAPKPDPAVVLDHLHTAVVSVRQQAEVLASRLRELRRATFRRLVADAPDPMTTVARFLALLELHGAGMVGFEQVASLGELHVRWTGPDDGAVEVGAQFDDRPGPEADER